MMGSPGPTKVPDPGTRWTCTTWRTGPTRTDPATWTGCPPVVQGRGPTRRVRSTHGAGRPWTARAPPGARRTARNPGSRTSRRRGATTAWASRTQPTARTARPLRTWVTAITALRTGRARAVRTGPSQGRADWASQGRADWASQGRADWASQGPGDQAGQDQDPRELGNREPDSQKLNGQEPGSKEPGSEEPGSEEPGGPHAAATGRTEGARVYVLGESRRRGR